ncbi:MAG: adenosine-specific kinase [Desulfobacterota bacterium]|nr:adenosine-specific kinase [Thermodesulfobacteriota bacterium]
MEITTVPISFPENTNVIIGQAHFIKTVEDLFEIMVTTVPGMKFGIAFNEASGPCLIRTEGNDDGLVRCAAENCRALGAGHVFVIVIKDAYPINVLNSIKQCQEVCRIFCATANPVTAIVAKHEKGGGVMGVIDGESPRGIETPEDREKRRALLRSVIGYKR